MIEDKSIMQRAIDDINTSALAIDVAIASLDSALTHLREAIERMEMRRVVPRLNPGPKQIVPSMPVDW